MACALFYSRLPSLCSVRYPPGLFCQPCARSVPIPPPGHFSSFIANKDTYLNRPLGLPCATLGWPLRDPWVTQGWPIDKSEGPVKQKLSLAMPEHRFVCHRTLTTEDTGKHLYLNHLSVEGFAVVFACRSTNHRFGPTTAMILLFEHPTSMLGARAPNQSRSRFLAGQDHPRAALDANDLWISRVGAKHPEESYGQLARRCHLGHTFRSVVATMQILLAKPGIIATVVCAASTSSMRINRFPCLLIPPSRCLPPELYSRGIRPR